NAGRQVPERVGLLVHHDLPGPGRGRKNAGATRDQGTLLPEEVKRQPSKPSHFTGAGFLIKSLFIASKLENLNNAAVTQLKTIILKSGCQA
ncbi:MAG: hypothetical protein WBA16_02600, partial [Nonlabens sp.]